MVHWELREKYDKQDTKFQGIRARYDQAVIAAGTHLADLKAEQEALLRREFQSGDDLSAEKAKVREKIEAAEHAKATAEVEQREALDYTRVIAGGEGRITIRDLTLDWNGSYLNEIREKELQPIADRMREARDAYYNAVLDFYETIDHYEFPYQELRDLAYHDNVHHSGNHMYPHELRSAVKIANLSNDDLTLIQDRRKLPDGVKRTVNGGKAE